MQPKPIDFTRSTFSVFFAYIGRHKRLFVIDMVCAVIVAVVDLLPGGLAGIPDLIRRRRLQKELEAKEGRDDRASA